MKGSRTFKDRVFVLTTLPYRDSDLIVNFLSQENGKLTAVIYGGKRIGKSSSFLFQPGDFIELEFQKSETKEFIAVLNSFGLSLLVLDKFPYSRFLFHTYLIEIISKISKPELPSDQLFEILKANIVVEWNNTSSLSFIFWAIWKVIEAGGYEIDFSACSCCLRHTWQLNQQNLPVFRKMTYHLHEDIGRIVCADCSKVSTVPLTITPAMLKILWLVQRSVTFEQHLVSLPQELVWSLIKAMNGYLLRCFEISPNSLDPFMHMITSVYPLKPLKTGTQQS